MVPTPHQSPSWFLWDILEGLAWPPTGRVGPMCSIMEALADMGVPKPPFTGGGPGLARGRGCLEEVLPKETWGTASGGKVPGGRA